MAIDFPNSPVTNDTYVVGDRKWVYDGEKWALVSASPELLVVSATAPTNTNVIWADTTVTGVGVVPVGGTTNQVLAKSSSADYDAVWKTPQYFVCTSSTRPSSPITGQSIYETDTNLVYVWDSSAWKPISTTSINASNGYLRYQTSWTTATYATGWASYDANSWGNAAYYRSVDGIVHLRSLVKRISGSSGLIFTLPVGYRPPHIHLFAVAGSGGVARIDINTAGEVLFSGNQSGTVDPASWVSLFEVKFGVF
jgi:hypothetical protein